MSVAAALGILKANLGHAAENAMRRATQPGAARYLAMHAGAGAAVGGLASISQGRRARRGLIGGALAGAAFGLAGGTSGLTRMIGSGLEGGLGAFERTRFAGVNQMIRANQAAAGMSMPGANRMWRGVGKFNRFMGARPGMFF